MHCTDQYDYVLENKANSLKVC